ncbi:MAG: ABC transporter substrate-binding protein [Candidatus Cyclobacteriaceae bacterium M3_2C_046]
MKISWKVVVLALLVASCSPNKEKDQSLISKREAKGGRSYGGILKLNESEYIKNLFPHSITDAFSYRVASQIYEGLFKFNQTDLSLEKSLAESYEIDSTGTIYTIKLKEGVYFHDDDCFEQGKGRELTAEDVAYCFTQLCTQRLQNQSFNSIFKGILQGGESYYEASSQGQKPNFKVSGIEVVDKYSLRLKLNKPNAIFLINLARPACFIYPKEAWEKYGQDMRIHAIGTGPFQLNQVDENISLSLVKHHKYHGQDKFGNQLPFLDGLYISFLNNKKTELYEFRKKKLDMVYRLPTEHIIEILEETNVNENGEIQNFELQRVPEMVSQFIIFNTNHPQLKNKWVRKALNFAVDRNKILNFVLNGEGFDTGHHGITPPVFDNYNIENIAGYHLNLDSARYYLKKAGYNSGNEFPSLELLFNAEGERNTQVAIEIQKQFKDHLNIDLKLTILPFAQLLERGYQGKFDMIRIAWYADFPSPENFLWLFSGKDVPSSPEQNAYPNIARYINPLFDQYYEKALGSKDIETANQFFQRAESVLMKDAPLLVLWYDEGYRLLQSFIKNFPNNPMQYRDFSEVYIYEGLKEEI